uniref:NAB domain-containing protein n=1 Tax=Lactuca sativa TaxID=4236 RepID=A0A9R1XN92_LACSA|nr:hypothetical protein LSAT_V11C200097300 [Lactuca sativa]
MEGVESKSQSPGQGSRNMPENSAFLFENVEGFQQRVKEILNVIEQDENSPKIGDIKKSKLTAMVTELSRMHMALADEHVHLIKEVSKNTHKFTTPIKTQHVDSSTSSSAPMSKTDNIMTPVGYEFTLDTSGGGFHFSTREGSESSFTLSSSSDSESFMSISKNLNSPVKDDASKSKETKVHDPKVLLKKISTLEKEQSSLKKKIQNLTDENALLEAEKSNVAELKRMISESNRKIETMGNVIEASRKQVSTAHDENSKLIKEMSNKVFGKVFNSIEKQAAIGKKDEQITELNNELNRLKIAHAAEMDALNTEIEMLKTKLGEK